MTHSPLLLSLLIFSSAAIAGLIPIAWNWSEKSFGLFTSFAAGVLLTVAMVHMLPAGYPLLEENLGVFLLLGFLIIFLFERFGPAHTKGDEHCVHIGWSALAGLIVHSFISGIALGASIAESHLLTLLLSAILIHKLPEILATSALLLQSHWPKKRIVVAILVLAAMEPAGLLLSSQTLLSPYILSVMLTVSTGMFLYVATQEFLPTLFRAPTPPWRKLAAFFLGIGIVLLS
jgi:zinc transporter ZupT